MGFRDFEPFLTAAYASHSRQYAMMYAIEAFLERMYSALGLDTLYHSDIVEQAKQLYDRKRSQDYSQEAAWLTCERTIVNTIQQDFIKSRKSNGFSTHAAYAKCRQFMQNECGCSKVFDQYPDIITSEVSDNDSDHHSEPSSRHTYNTYTTAPRGNARGPRSGQTEYVPRTPHSTYYKSTRSGAHPSYRQHTSHAHSRRRSPSPSPKYRARSPPAPPSKRSECLYKVLGVPRTATADEIKTAHRKLMLRWHPDRNHGNEETATVQTGKINAARDVLSDAKKRAWYDRTGQVL